jgi:hypothetical protein
MIKRIRKASPKRAKAPGPRRGPMTLDHNTGRLVERKTSPLFDPKMPESFGWREFEYNGVLHQHRQDTFNVIFHDEEALERHLSVLSNKLSKKMSNTQEDDHALMRAFNYFNFSTYLRGSMFGPVFLGEIMTVPNTHTVRTPAVEEDFFDLLRTLDDTMKSLSKEIRAINDRTKLTPEIRAARAYLDAFRAFLDVEVGDPPQTVPASVPRGLLAKLRQVDWLRVSENAHNTIIDALTKGIHW